LQRASMYTPQGASTVGRQQAAAAKNEEFCTSQRPARFHGKALVAPAAPLPNTTQEEPVL